LYRHIYHDVTIASDVHFFSRILDKRGTVLTELDSEATRKKARIRRHFYQAPARRRLRAEIGHRKAGDMRFLLRDWSAKAR
jgi:hypothetical protein